MLNREVYVSVLVSLFGGAFGFACGITQRKDDGMIVEARHLL